MRTFTVPALLLMLSASWARAEFVMVDRDIPVDKIVRQVTDHIKQNPKDAHGYYLLGRVHSIAWAKGGNQVRLVPPPITSPVKPKATGADSAPRSGASASLPSFGPYASLELTPPTEPISKEDEVHLVASIANYRKAVALDPANGLYQLGLGWMLEQQLGTTAAIPPSEQKAFEAAVSEVVAIYIKAFELTLEKELKADIAMSAGDALVSLEAANNIVRLSKTFPTQAPDAGGLKRIVDGRSRLITRPMAVTPIIVGLEPEQTLASMVDPEANVDFDLSGLDTDHRWPWVKANTGILVWDPHRGGDIRSGRQLFGPMTWQMRFRDGYQALAMLDDNGDGYLSGGELQDVGIWFDTNGDSISDPGEVKEVANVGITRISVRAARDAAGELTDPKGITWRDGVHTPTFDWTPTSHRQKLGASGAAL